MGDAGEITDQSRQAPLAEGSARPPAGWREKLAANCRPQPAIPALLVLFITILGAVLSYDPLAAPQAGRSAFTLLIPVGIALSCGLGIAAGFCSFVPPLAWSLVAGWGLKFTVAGPLPAYNRYVFYAGIAASAVMLGVQAWRVATGRFVPTMHSAATETGAEQ